MAKRRLALADLITGLALAIAGVAILILSIDMPRFEERGVNPWTVPGIMPGVVGAVLAVLASVLILRSIRAVPATAAPSEAQVDHLPEPSARPFGAGAVVLASIVAGGYVVLLGTLPFGPLTFVFLMIFMLAFEGRMLRHGVRPWRRLAVIVGAAATVAVIVPYVFETLFLVRLP